MPPTSHDGYKKCYIYEMDQQISGIPNFIFKLYFHKWQIIKIINALWIIITYERARESVPFTDLTISLLIPNFFCFIQTWINEKRSFMDFNFLELHISENFYCDLNNARAGLIQRGIFS